MSDVIFESLISAIGNTPLVRIPFDAPARVYAKLEYLNPGGSIKDRTALYMIRKAEQEKLLLPGGTIIEASSGNQGIATAMIANILGYRCIIVCSEKVSKEKRETLEAYGVDIVLCKPTKFLTDPESYYSRALEIHQKTPNSFFLQQYFNNNNLEAHYYGIARELWKSFGSSMTHFVAAAGSGGTLSGTSRYLKEQNKSITTIGVDSCCSYLATKGNPLPYSLEGMGVDYDSPVLDFSVIDHMDNVTDNQAISMLKTLAREHGILVGPASGAVAYSAFKQAEKLTEKDIVVTIFTDSGRAYLSKGFYV